jgi:cobalamin biosynthesis protein CobW
LLKAFDWPAIRARLTVDGVIAVVDGPAVAEGRFADDPAAVAAQRAQDESVDHDNPLEEVFEDQVLCADLIVLNKTDLIDPAHAAAVTKTIRESAPRARIVEAREGRIDPAILLGLGAAAEDDIAARPSHHDNEDEHDHEDFESFVIEIPEIAEADTLRIRLADIAGAHDILRIKGFVAVRGKPMRLLVQGVGSRFSQSFATPWRANEGRHGRLVVIGQKGLDRAAIEMALHALAPDAVTAAAG